MIGSVISVVSLEGRYYNWFVIMIIIYITYTYHMSGEVISVLSLEGKYYNCHERAQRGRNNYDTVT